MKVKIISDSSSNMFSMTDVDFTSVPLRIVTNDKEYVDTTELDVPGMVSDLSAYNGRSGTACPGVGDYLEAFEGYDEIYCVTITSNLSGSYNAAMTAKQQYEEDHPDAKVHIIDSLSAGAELKLHLNKLKSLISEGKAFEDVVSEIEDYKENHTRLQFCLESLHNLANNGRVNPAVAKIAGLVGLRMVGDATGGVLNPNDKCRGEKKALSTLFSNMKKAGYNGGTVFIDHCLNDKTANSLKELILAEFPNALVELGAMGGLCSFYAEKGGMIIGYEI
ncbi:MAG: DegV family protein [Roseburia sp.]|nr:DegV family protein [Roseburia sp.]